MSIIQMHKKPESLQKYTELIFESYSLNFLSCLALTWYSLVAGFDMLVRHGGLCQSTYPSHHCNYKWRLFLDWKYSFCCSGIPIFHLQEWARVCSPPWVFIVFEDRQTDKQSKRWRDRQRERERARYCTRGLVSFSKRNN